MSSPRSYLLPHLCEFLLFSCSQITIISTGLGGFWAVPQDQIHSLHGVLQLLLGLQFPLQLVVLYISPQSTSDNWQELVKPGGVSEGQLSPEVVALLMNVFQGWPLLCLIVTLLLWERGWEGPSLQDGATGNISSRNFWFYWLLEELSRGWYVCWSCHMKLNVVLVEGYCWRHYPPYTLFPDGEPIGKNMLRMWVTQKAAYPWNGLFKKKICWVLWIV